ncbi:hypothetical protein [Psychromonas ossibalaenae]|uniref:hypothetical protein n=1 Tax=Psychromonas ossibalaenae TaxID=444922 RepID=UPI00037839B6|nr:hypothetical protein [Psychromonas ossibalaenae]
MAIQNNTSFVTRPVNTGKAPTVKSSPQAGVSELAPVTKKAKSAEFSMILSEKQQDSLHKTLGYDQPGFKQRGAVDAYQQVAVQEQREAIMSSMSFHFVV